MPVAYFQVPLSIDPKGGGEAELKPPKALEGLNFRFVIVREGGEVGIIEVEEPAAVIKKIEKEKDCTALTPRQMDEARKKYPQPKLKSKFRMREQSLKQGETAANSEPYELDKKGNKIIDTFQTVRSGFFLIDVPITGQDNG